MSTQPEGTTPTEDELLELEAEHRLAKREAEEVERKRALEAELRAKRLAVEKALIKKERIAAELEKKAAKLAELKAEYMKEETRIAQRQQQQKIGAEKIAQMERELSRERATNRVECDPIIAEWTKYYEDHHMNGDESKKMRICYNRFCSGQQLPQSQSADTQPPTTAWVKNGKLIGDWHLKVDEPRPSDGYSVEQIFHVIEMSKADKRSIRLADIKIGLMACSIGFLRDLGVLLQLSDPSTDQYVVQIKDEQDKLNIVTKLVMTPHGISPAVMWLLYNCAKEDLVRACGACFPPILHMYTTSQGVLATRLMEAFGAPIFR